MSVDPTIPMAEYDEAYGKDDEPAASTDQNSRLLPSPSAPLQVARRLLEERYLTDDGYLVLRHWRGGVWKWQGTKWVEAEMRSVRAEAYWYTEYAEYVNDKGEVKPWLPNRRKVADLVDATAGAAHLEENVVQPGWIESVDLPPARELVSMTNGLLHVPTRKLYPHNPRLWNQTAVPFAYEADAPPPARWLEFLDQLWPDDREAIAALQEFFGYVISGRTDQHKILLLVGPTRAGKGVIARILKALVGDGNHAGPTMAGLATNFGLSPLIGKPLAIVADARLGGGNQHQVVERLLSISGEDVLTIDRKYRDPWTGTLPTRFVVISNELPNFGDASGAIANRFVILTLQTSWLGKENVALTDELYEELPGILGWALDGLTRLEDQGRFTEPASSVDAAMVMHDSVSPVSAFVRDRCERSGEVLIDDVWAAWQTWADANGHRRSTKQELGKRLRAVVPGLKVQQHRDGDGDRPRSYAGLSLNQTHDGQESVTARDTTPSRNGTRRDPLSVPPDDKPTDSLCDVPEHILEQWAVEDLGVEET